jgi:long-chain acyl-CoA synthetase
MTAPQNDDVISPKEAVTLHGLFLERVRRTPDKIAYTYFDNRQSVWVDLSWDQMREQVARWQAALSGEGLVKGDRVAIMLRNCPQWVLFDQAAMSLGLIVVPLYTVDRAENIAYIVNDAQVKVMLFETATQWQELSGVVGQMGCVQRFVALDEFKSDETRLVSAARYLHKQVTELRPAVPCETGELASIIYTSGTTGKPKGVMLSHGNMLSNIYDGSATFAILKDDLLLSFLPLSHTFERTCGYYMQVMSGARVAYARSIPLLAEDMLTIRPTLLISVPRIYERIHAAVNAKLREGSPLKHALFNLAVRVGWSRFEHQQGRGRWKFSFLLWPLLNRLVAKKILDRMGGRLRCAVTSGAALAPEISHMFVGLGLPVVQGYGMTETSPIVCGNKLDNNFPDSVGQVIRNVQVRIGDQSALLVKGPNVMMGYWKNPEATSAIIDANGWLNTGDTAHISETGHIYITGRLKEIVVLSNGEKMPPADMEAAIMHDPLIDQVMIYGEGKPYLVALVVLNPVMWPQIAAKVGVRHDLPESLTDSNVEAKVLRRIARNISSFPGYAKVHRVMLFLEPWSVENGMLTPTLKLKRTTVSKQFAAQIDELYKGH